MKFGVIIFPGSNCDHDAYHVLGQVAKQPVTFLWHESHDLQDCDAVIVPGGFAYGDYMRTGAIAALAPIMESVKKFAASGGLVLGLCNGFQILWHMEGNYFCDPETLEKLQREQRIVFRYATPQGEITAAANPNGSLDNIAGICSEGRNVLGMMPHPERASEPELGMTDGFKVMQSLVGALAAK
jgi:phosphoribosylformylglycinamidine synthase